MFEEAKVWPSKAESFTALPFSCLEAYCEETNGSGERRNPIRLGSRGIVSDMAAMMAMFSLFVSYHSSAIVIITCLLWIYGGLMIFLCVFFFHVLSFFDLVSHENLKMALPPTPVKVTLIFW